MGGGQINPITFFCPINDSEAYVSLSRTSRKVPCVKWIPLPEDLCRPVAYVEVIVILHLALLGILVPLSFFITLALLGLLPPPTPQIIKAKLRKWAWAKKWEQIEKSQQYFIVQWQRGH